ncbi:MAG: accessory gene regulator B family protein [Lachnospiraceae bacterium]|nr:accessory gene regulator B family protein [Lachnospiraceae bacterium]
MIEKCADAITNWLISYEVVGEKDKELYIYAVYSILLSLSPMLLVIGFGICMGCVVQSVMIMLPSVIIRKFSGGYHTKNAWSCLIGSCFLLIICMVLSSYIKSEIMLALITVGAVGSLIYFSPIDNENRVLGTEEHNRYKRITTVLVMVFLFLDVSFFSFRLNTYFICISIAIILSASLQLPCILSRIVKKII